VTKTMGAPQTPEAENPGGAHPANSFEAYFARLEGKWRLDRRASDGSRFEGIATFQALAGRRHLLTESGLFFPAGSQPMTAGRQWTWLVSRDGHLEIRYPPPHGRPYHRFLPLFHGAAFCGTASHLCAADIYDAIYQLHENLLRIDHSVAGPAKNYSLHSTFLRI
jgi:hypothetical protein